MPMRMTPKSSPDQDPRRRAVPSTNPPTPEYSGWRTCRYGPVETTRGRATAPIWQFTIQGSRVLITRVAIAGPVTPQPPPWNANNPPVGISIDGAVGLPADARLIVSFVGAPDPGNKACGADYTAEAVESDLAIVVIVTEHAFPLGGACSAVGAIRTATVQLASPLGRRAVLEVKEGLPVEVSAP